MAGGTTRVADIIVPELFTAYVQQYTTEKSAIIQSGAASVSEFLNNFLAGPGLTIQVPHFKDLDNDDERISTDSDQTAVTHHKIGTAKEIAVRLSRNNSWSSSDLSGALAGTDPMQRIADRVGAYWTRRLQKVFIAVINGVFADNLANDGGDMRYDVSGNSYSRNLTDFSAEVFVDAAQTMGDNQDGLSMLIVHSVVYARMKKNNMIDFVPDSEQQVRIPTFLNHRVVVDDGMPNAGGVYDSWIFGPNVAEIGLGAPKTPVETDRNPGASQGAGEEILYNRVEWCVHPVGFRYTGQDTARVAGNPPTGADDGGPTNATLAAAATWDRAYSERKMINMVRLLTRER